MRGDAASARVFAATGFHAIATTSGGIANARGLPDAERISRSDMLREISAIADAVDVPVSAVGINLEDPAADVAHTGTWHSLERTFLGFEYANTLFGRTPRRAIHD